GYFLHHRSQLRINPVMITGFIFLNVNTPPFNQLRVRQALNLALDRRRIVSSYGGPLAAQPACQILPPPLPGYHPSCPHTTRPTPAPPPTAPAPTPVAPPPTAAGTGPTWRAPGSSSPPRAPPG